MMIFLVNGAIAAAVLLALGSCSGPERRADEAAAPEASSARPVVLARDEGERRVLRFPGPPRTFILKVDPKNSGSRQLLAGYQDIAPGDRISPHRHVGADELIFLHKGRALVEVGDIRREMSEGATIFVPRGTRMAMRPSGTEPITIFYVLSDPGYAGYMRDVSVKEGEPVVPLSDAERDSIRASHRAHVEYE
ncbi:cupin domain-containing protein [Sphingomonas sp.]|jgi:quercetin dioxygenase-like cupin family protein|uniref:cupin domain-containing protein n=1 Tax=Sphingomonas sp. TaxID=28214 RepID=UPI0017A34B00|nr:cupin domain-containing protein [Sphingomonas sp.]MBA3511146.1 cupin domain-containing protein [Sphingomonas sp.]